MIGTAARTWPRPAPHPEDADLLPVLPALAGLLPGAGLRRGSVVTLDQAGALALALTAGVSAAGGWCAWVDLPECGVLAAAGMGVDPDRLLLVDRTGPHWAEVVAVLLDGVEMVLTRPPARPSASMARRLAAVARRRGGVLVALGEHAAGWEGATLRLRTADAVWAGVGDGHGHLRGCRVRVVAEGQGVGGRPRVARLWLPGPDGQVTGADLTDVGDGASGPLPQRPPARVTVA
jgi:hypothetical protein